MANTNEYIVFEADQVLTNEHLNETFRYLDQQNRWTRNKLIGIGIVCGFNLVHHTGVIDITKGVGVTSQGYLILKDKDSYAYFMLYSPVDQPADLPFDYPGKLPFFKPFCENKTIYLLLTDDEYNALEDAKKPDAKTLSSQASGFLSDYVVVLFLEATETDLKNCSAFDCTNKGEKMQFNVRPLLVAKKDLPTAAVTVSGAEKERLRFSEFGVEIEQARRSHEIMFKRYNVPYTAINNSEEVLGAFVKLVDDDTLQEVANAYIYSYEKHSALLSETNNPFINLFKELKKYRDEILAENPIFIQYFYDFIDDLIKAYYEFCVKLSRMTSACCPDENLFPLHLVLGDASKDTSATVQDAWRNYFIYSPLFAKAAGEISETQFLFRRMQIMVKEFTMLVTDPNRKAEPIKITPSQLGLPWLSQRAIPYYYHISTGNNAIYNYWNYHKTTHGNAVFNLSYNIDLYNHAKAALQPLLYDIEHYNFFRIEGHIGENYQHVLRELLKQRLAYNLPFDVVAISADMLRSNARLPECNMLDLETDYKLIISEFACKVHTPFCFLARLPYPPTDNSFTSMKEGLATEKFSSYRMKAMSHFTNAAGIVIEKTAYVKGDFMRKYCSPDEGTVGRFYLDLLSKNQTMNAEITGFNEMTNERTSMLFIYNYIFGFINAVEELMLLLNTNTVATQDIDQLKDRYESYTKSASQLTFILAELIASEKLQLSAFLKALEFDILIDEFFILLTVCIDERLQTLVEEYMRRLQMYQLQSTFLNYYRKHPGLEHKAGVPKGGTFVVVYYSGRREVTTFPGRTEVTTVEQATPARGAVMEKAVEQKIIYKQYDSTADRMIREFVDNCKDAPDDSKKKIIEILNRGRTPKTRFSFIEGEVIADFYVPYLCCSDCPPIAYVLPKEKEPVPEPDQPTIDMDTTFCDNDDKPYDITVSPAGGKVTDEGGNEVNGVDNTVFTFTPLKAGAGVYKLIYTAGGVSSDPKTVTVLEMPKESNFKIGDQARQEDGTFVVMFQPDIQDTKFTYEWKFGTGLTPSSSAEIAPKITAKVDPTGAQTSTFASLLISNGNNCSAPAVTMDLMISGNGVFNPGTFIDTNFNELIKKNKEKEAAKTPVGTAVTEEPAAETPPASAPAAPAPAKTGEVTVAADKQSVDKAKEVTETKAAESKGVAETKEVPKTAPAIDTPATPFKRTPKKK